MFMELYGYKMLLIYRISSSDQQGLIQYIDRTVRTTNPTVHPDGSNISEAQIPQLNPHICNQPICKLKITSKT